MSKMAVIYDTRLTLKKLAGLLIAGLALVSTETAAAADLQDAQEPNLLREIARPGSDLHLGDDAKVQAIANGHFAAGLLYRIKREEDKAHEQFYKAALADPSREKLVITVADGFIRQRKPERALEILEQAAKRDEASGRIHGLLGFVYSQLGKPELAIKSIHRAIKETPEELPPYIFLAKAHRDAGEWGKSLKALQDAMKIVPETQSNLLNVSAEALMISPKDKAAYEASRKFAISLLDKVELDDMGDVQLLDRLATNYKFAGAPEKALAVYVRAVRLYPDSTQFRARLADLYIQTEQWELAEKQLNFLIGQRPDAAGDIYIQLGEIALERKDYVAARKQYQKAVLLAPDKEYVYYQLARLWVFEDKHAEALKTLAKARDKFPASFLMEYTASLIFNQMKKYDEAGNSLVAAEKIAKGKEPRRLNYQFYFETATTFERAKKFRKAEFYFRTVFELKPDFADALNYLGYMWTELEINLPEAREMIEKAVKQEPDNAAFLDSMAWVLFKLKQPGEALDWQLKAVKFAEKPDSVLYDHLGDIYAALTRMKEAREAWEKALELEPNPAIEAKLGKKGKRVSSTGAP